MVRPHPGADDPYGVEAIRNNPLFDRERNEWLARLIEDRVASGNKPVDPERARQLLEKLYEAAAKLPRSGRTEEDIDPEVACALVRDYRREARFLESSRTEERPAGCAPESDADDEDR